jgi:hypothetical protein
MRVATSLHHPTCRAAGLWLLALALLGGCEEPLRQTLRGALVDDPALKEAARDMTRSVVEVLEVRLGSPEMRRQVDALVAEVRRVATARPPACATRSSGT